MAFKMAAAALYFSVALHVDVSFFCHRVVIFGVYTMQGLGGIKEYISIVFGQTGMPAAKCIPIRRQEYFTTVLF